MLQSPAVSFLNIIADSFSLWLRKYALVTFSLNVVAMTIIRLSVSVYQMFLAT